MAINIRDAKPDDVEKITRFNVFLASESESRQLDATVARRGVESVLADDRVGRVVGQMMITFEFSDWRDGMFWWIQSVYVTADARRQGVFRALFEHVSQLSRDAESVCGLRLYVEQDNHAAHATYEKLGMVTTGYCVRECDWSGVA